MKPETAEVLRALLREQQIAALGTLHRSEPYVSMVPYALDEAGAFLIHVSQLAPHTRDMLDHPRVSLLVVAAQAGPMPQARARATVQGDAVPLPADSESYEAAKSIYLARFAQAADIFALPDFSLFRIAPASVRLIAGFAQAASLTADAYARCMKQP